MYELSRDRDRMNVDVIHGFLSTCYWSPGIRRDLVERAIRNSEVIGAFETATGAQVGFARVVSDLASFAWLCDVFVLEPHRGHRLATRMVRTLLDDPVFASLRRWCLATRDAQDVYQPLGFERIPPERIWMERRMPVSAWQQPGFVAPAEPPSPGRS